MSSLRPGNGSSLPVSAEDRIASLESELELSAFLNKGILQTNTEYKAKITQLEAENELLRSAEARLTRTEEKLEDAERKLRQTKRDLEEKEKAWRLKERQRRAREDERGRMVAEVELESQEWQRKFVRLAKTLEGFRGVLDSAVRDAQGGGEPLHKVITRARTSGTRLPDVKPSPSASRSLSPDDDDDNEDEDPLPSYTTSSKEPMIAVTQPTVTSSVRATHPAKRQRLAATPETDEMIISALRTPEGKLTPKQRQPLEAQHATSGAKRKSTPVVILKGTAKTSAIQSEPADEKPVMRLWKQTAAPPSESDDDLDPLAMSDEES